MDIDNEKKNGKTPKKSEIRYQTRVSICRFSAIWKPDQRSPADPARPLRGRFDPEPLHRLQSDSHLQLRFRCFSTVRLRTDGLIIYLAFGTQSGTLLLHHRHHPSLLLQSRSSVLFPALEGTKSDVFSVRGAGFVRRYSQTPDWMHVSLSSFPIKTFAVDVFIST